METWELIYGANGFKIIAGNRVVCDGLTQADANRIFSSEVLLIALENASRILSDSTDPNAVVAREHLQAARRVVETKETYKDNLVCF